MIRGIAEMLGQFIQSSGFLLLQIGFIELSWRILESLFVGKQLRERYSSGEMKGFIFFFYLMIQVAGRTLLALGVSLLLSRYRPLPETVTHEAVKSSVTEMADPVQRDKRLAAEIRKVAKEAQLPLPSAESPRFLKLVKLASEIILEEEGLDFQGAQWKKSIAAAIESLQDGVTFSFENEVLDLEVAAEGGRIIGARLKRYTAGDPSEPLVELLAPLSEGGCENQDQLILDVEGKRFSTNHLIFKPSVVPTTDLEESNVSLVLTASLEPKEGETITIYKRFHLPKSGYELSITHEVEAPEGLAIQVKAVSRFVQATRERFKQRGSKIQPRGGAVEPIYLQEEKALHSRSLSEFTDEKRLAPLKTQEGWIALVQKPFVAVMATKGSGAGEFSGYWDSDLQSYLIGYSTQKKALGEGGRYSHEFRYFLGPMDQSLLKQFNATLPAIIRHGFLGDPLAVLFRFLAQKLGNWGWAIVALSLLVQLVGFLPLELLGFVAERKRKYYATLVKIHPHGSKKAARAESQVMRWRSWEIGSKLIYTAGSCVFLYVVGGIFRNGIEIRGAPFLGWVKDLSRPDRFGIWPVLVLLTQLLMGMEGNVSPIQSTQSIPLIDQAKVRIAVGLFYIASCCTGPYLPWSRIRTLTLLFSFLCFIQTPVSPVEGLDGKNVRTWLSFQRFLGRCFIPYVALIFLMGRLSSALSLLMTTRLLAGKLQTVWLKHQIAQVP